MPPHRTFQAALFVEFRLCVRRALLFQDAAVLLEDSLLCLKHGLEPLLLICAESWIVRSLAY
jgi:hypothetical protein